MDNKLFEKLMNEQEDSLDQQIVDYREDVEGQVGNLVDLLELRGELLTRVPEVSDQNRMILGGDKYLKDWLGIKVEVEGREKPRISFHDLPEELIKFFQEVEKEKLEHDYYPPTEAYEFVMYSLCDIYNLPADFPGVVDWIQAPCWVENKIVIFDTGRNKR